MNNFPQVEVKATAKSNGLSLYFPWASVLIILGSMFFGGIYAWRSLDQRLTGLNSTLISVSDAANTLSTELRNIREFYSELDKKVAILDNKVQNIESRLDINEKKQY